MYMIIDMDKMNPLKILELVLYLEEEKIKYNVEKNVDYW